MPAHSDETGNHVADFDAEVEDGSRCWGIWLVLAGDRCGGKKGRRWKGYLL